MLGFHNLVTLAGALFQNLPVENPDMAARVANRSLFFQAVSGDADGLTLEAQHVRDELMRHLQFIVVRPVMGHQHPAAESLLGCVETIADGGL